jgi:outer membrane protein assembly factor BamB
MNQQRLSNIQSIDLMGKDLILHTKSGELLKNGDKINEAVSGYRVWGNTLLYTLDAGGLIIYSEGKSKSIQGNFFLSHFWGEHGRFIVLREEQDGDIYYECSRDFEMHRLDINNSFIKQFYKDYYISQEGDALCCYTLDGKLLWQYSINNLLGGNNSVVMSNLVPFKDKLFFYLNDYTLNASKTFCLRITTGEILEATEDMKGWLMLCGDKLFATNKKSVLVMDANSLTVQSLDIEDQLSYLPDHLGMSYNKFQVVNNFLFYAGERALDVGIVDISEKKLLWTKQLENVIRQILAYDNKFCVLDARDNFYSFEYK